MEESVNTEVLDKAMISNSSSEMFVCLLACVAHIINMLKSISDYIYIYNGTREYKLSSTQSMTYEY